MKHGLLGDISNGVWIGLAVASVWVFAATTSGVLYLFLPDNLKMWFGPRMLLVAIGALLFASYVVYSKVMKVFAGSNIAVEDNSIENEV